MASEQQERVTEVVVSRLLPASHPVSCGDSSCYENDNKDTTGLRDSGCACSVQQPSDTEAKAISSRFLERLEALLRQKDLSGACSSEFLESYQDFKDLVLQCYPTVVQELQRDESRQTFPPSPNIMGIAGGEKRLCLSCVRLKIPQRPVKHQNLYPSPEEAAKTCKHEQIGVDAINSALLKCQNKTRLFITTPGMVVDFLGYRGFAYADLPLHKCSLKVGKNGETYGFPCSDPETVNYVNALMVDQGLSPHGLTYEGKTTPEHERCVLPCDTEVYQMDDEASSDTYYVVDTARIMPPRGRSTSEQRDLGGPLLKMEHGYEEKNGDCAYLFKHFRKEFVETYYRTFGIRLSSDAFYPMSLPEENQRIQDAEAYYRPTVPKKVAEDLEAHDCALFSKFLVFFAHNRGSNLHELGDVHNLLDRRSPWRQRILVEVTARSFRRVVNSEWRWLVETGAVSKQAVISVLIDFLNFTLGEFKDSTSKSSNAIWYCINVWKDECFPALKGVMVSRETIMQPKSLEMFMDIISELLGVTWNEEPWLHESDVKSFISKSKPFEFSLVQSVNPRVIEMSLVYMVRSLMFASLGNEKDALKELHKALARHPKNPVLLKSLAGVYERLVSQEECRSMESSSDYSIKQKFLSSLALEVSGDEHVEMM